MDKKIRAALVLAALLALPAAAYAQTAPPLDRNPGPRFQTFCGVVKVAAIDPILDPEPGHAHDHVFSGNPGVSADSTGASLQSNPETSCGLAALTGSYWHPVTTDSSDGVQEIERIVVYYQGWGDQTKIESVPRGLQMISKRAKYRCGTLRGTAFEKTPPYGCEQPYQIKLSFPECWNGTSRGPDSVAYRIGDQCPAGFPHLLPHLRLRLDYPNTDGELTEPLNVSAGAGEFEPYTFMHGDSFEAPQQPAFRQLVQTCIRQVADDEIAPEKPCLSQ